MAACSKKPDNYFIGTINYHYTYSSNLLNADSLTLVKPVESYLRYDENNYQSSFINADTIVYYYSGSYNKCISEKKGMQTYECEDYSVVTDSVLSFKLYDTSETVLGYKCRVLELQKKNSQVQYWVSTDLIISPATYKKHVSYNWDVYGEKAKGGLILKSLHHFPAYTMTGVATNVAAKDKFKALEVDEALFTTICK